MTSSTQKEFRESTNRKIRTANALIKAREWEASAYIMGYILECALKASACKTLNIHKYPPLKQKEPAQGFISHEFEQLLIISGLTDIFGNKDINGNLRKTVHTKNWASFTSMYPGSWVDMRYKDMSRNFSENTIKELAKKLYDSSDSIIQTIKRKRRW